MSDDDVRWADHLLERARAVATPREDDAARNLASIEARLGVGPAPEASVVARGGRPPSAQPKGGAVTGGVKGRWPGGAWAKSSWAKGSWVIAFGVSTGIVGYLIGRAETERRRAELAVDAAEAPALAVSEGAGAASSTPPAPIAAGGAAIPPAAASPSPAAPEESSATPQRSVSVVRRADRSSLAAPASKAATSAPAAREDAFALSDALELLRHAEAAVRRSDGLEARMYLSDLDRRAPPHLLLEERLVTLTLANCLLGDVDAARTTLGELESANAESIYRARLEESCVADRMRGVADRVRGR